MKSDWNGPREFISHLSRRYDKFRGLFLTTGATLDSRQPEESLSSQQMYALSTTQNRSLLESEPDRAPTCSATGRELPLAGPRY
jgi:hypothetical protein